MAVDGKQDLRTLVGFRNKLMLKAKNDDRLDNGDLGYKFYVAYLHILTSFCLPDPFTCTTGTEQALNILGSSPVNAIVVFVVKIGLRNFLLARIDCLNIVVIYSCSTILADEKTLILSILPQTMDAYML